MAASARVVLPANPAPGSQVARPAYFPVSYTHLDVYKRQAVAAAREAGQIVEMTSVVPVDVHVAYPQYEQVLRLAQDSGAKVSDTDYADAVTLHLVFKAGEQESFCARMRELMAGREEIEVGAPVFAEF